MGAHTNCFERLSDDLVGQIFEKVLWNPNAFGVPKALERLRLEAVCKRFQDLVHKAGCLVWEFSRFEDELAFLRYMLQQRKCATLFTRVAITVEHPVNVAAILQAIILQARDSLEEIHLSLGGAGAASIIDFEYMLLMFQACKELETLEVFYWTREQQLSERLLCNDWLPKPFARLRTLTLQGFGVSPLRLNAFIECFPLLTSLELNHLTGAAYTLGSNSLRKVFWWGNEAVGIDTETPSGVGVPRSLAKVVALLGSRNIEIKQKAVKVLLDLASKAGSREAITRAPRCLQHLRSLLQSPSAEVQKGVAELLWELAFDDIACKLVVQDPDIVPRLAELLTSEPLEAVNRDVLGALQSLATESKARVVIANAPECLHRLVDLLECGAMRELAACVLEKVVCDDALCETIPEVPVLVEKLVGLLDAGIPDAALEPVVGALKGLAWKFRALFVALPGCLQKLLSLLHSASSFVHQAAGDILENLGGSHEYGHTVWEVPGILKELVSLLGCANASAQVKAINVLHGFATDAAKGRVIASTPGCLQMLFTLLAAPNDVMFEGRTIRFWSTELLFALMRNEANVQKVVMETPGVLQKLAGNLATDGDGKNPVPSTTRLLKILTGDPANRRAIAAVPGCLETLVALLQKREFPQLQVCVLADLAEDAAIRKAIAAVPGALAGLLKVLRVAHVDAAKALKSLASDAETARAIAAVPGSTQKLESFRDMRPPWNVNRDELRELGAQILRRLGVEPLQSWGEGRLRRRVGGTSGGGRADDGSGAGAVTLVESARGVYATPALVVIERAEKSQTRLPLVPKHAKRCGKLGAERPSKVTVVSEAGDLNKPGFVSVQATIGGPSERRKGMTFRVIVRTPLYRQAGLTRETKTQAERVRVVLPAAMSSSTFQHRQ